MDRVVEGIVVGAVAAVERAAGFGVEQAVGQGLQGQGPPARLAVGGNSLRSTTDARGGGSVTFPSGVLPAGRHRVTASYAGGPEVLASSTGATVTVRPAVAAVTLTITPTDTGGFTVQARLRTSTAVAAGGGTVQGARVLLTLVQAPRWANGRSGLVGPPSRSRRPSASGTMS